MKTSKCKDFFIKNKFNNFAELENKLSKVDNTTYKGDLFEYFNYIYFCLNKDKYQIKKVYPFDEIPESLKNKYKLQPKSGKERGCDGIVIHSNDTIFSYQTKFMSNRMIGADKLMTSYQVGQRLDGWYVFSNVKTISHEFFKDNQKIPRVILFNDLDILNKLFFQNLTLYIQDKEIIRNKLEARSYQTAAVNDVCDGFKHINKGKFISACGTGKTITSLLIKEKLECKKTLFVVPSIYLVKQTIDEWLKYRSKEFKFLCVVSSFKPDSDDDRYDIDLSELGTYYTTDPQVIKNFLETDDPIVILSTYDSLPKVLEASKSIQFDLTFIDEAHRTAGIEKKKYQSCFNVLTKKKLFMTATPRVLKPNIKASAEIESLDFYSMDDADDYGNEFHHYSFRDAIDAGVIADYEIIIEIYDDDLGRLHLDKHTLIENEKFQNFDLVIADGIKKLIDNYSTNKIIVFTNTIDSANRKANAISHLTKNKDYFVDSISSKKTDDTRKGIMSEFRNSKKAVLTNARCLTEGVDVPDVDCVVFAERRQSVIDIVQAVGRCLRIPKDRPNKIAKIFIPIIIDKHDKKYNRKKFLHVFEIIEAIKAHDKSLEDEIDKINLSTSVATPNGGGKIKIKSYHKDINIQNISKNIRLEIAKLNSGKIKVLKKTLSVKKIVSSKTKFNIVRMAFPGWKNLIDKGIGVFSKEELTKSDVKKKYRDIHNKEIDNNLISYAYRAGMIRDHTDNIITLTPEGQRYVNDNTKKEFEYMIINMLKKMNNITWFPYNFSLNVLKNVKEIDRVEFLWGITICENVDNKSLEKCCARIKYIRDQNKDLDIMMSNEKHSKDYVDSLNNEFSDQLNLIGINSIKLETFLNLGKNDFVYFAKHMEQIFPDKIKSDKTKNKIILIE